MAILLFLICIFLSQATLNQASLAPNMKGTSFSYPSFDSDSCNTTLICMGSVSVGDGHLKLTQEPLPGNSNGTQPVLTDQIGRVLFRQPVTTWPASITTTFVVRIFPFENSTITGDGMTFIMAQNNGPSPPNSKGSYLGVLDKSTEGGTTKQIAVELDTYPNEFDPDGNHMGIDTTSITNPVAAKSLNSTGIYLTSGRNIKVQINYDSLSKNLEILVAYEGNPLMSFLNQSIDMATTVPNTVYVGFTAATGPYSEAHEVLNWTFQSTPLPDTKNAFEKQNRKKIILIVSIVTVGLVVVTLFTLPPALRDLRKRKEWSKRRADIESRSMKAANVPKMFTYRQLSRATRKFSKENLLGTGGFGSVYKGVIRSDPPTIIAVKKISATSRQGEKEYLAEICTIGRMRHKNIVQLQGWCHEREQLLLVYEYMPNGSLDGYIGRRFLDWNTRYRILTGLASALLYLHEQFGQPIIHRDVKPNNVMLDSDFNAHLGDFGLARLIRSDSAVTTMLAGTPGYLAPEVAYTGKATPESDVYSYGMVVIEVVTGQRSKGIFEENSLLDYVWDLHGRKALLEGVDRMLEGKHDEEQVKRAFLVGLACLHPDIKSRPTIRKVEQIFLNPNEPLMEVPESRPNAVFVPLVSSSFVSTTRSASDVGSKIDNPLLQSAPEEIVLDETVAHHREESEV